MREPRQLVVVVNARRLVSARRRGNLSGDDGIRFTIPASPHLPPLLLPNVIVFVEWHFLA